LSQARSFASSKVQHLNGFEAPGMSPRAAAACSVRSVSPVMATAAAILIRSGTLARA
jgi:hypothetical protein